MVIQETVSLPKDDGEKHTYKTKEINELVQRDLNRAIEQKDLEAFMFIISREGGDPFLHPEKRWDHRYSSFHTAAMIGCTEIVKYILESCDDPKAVINLREKNFGKTALHFAATHGNLETVRLLLLKGADPMPKAPDLWTPMHYAAENDHPEVIKVLLDHGANPDLQNESSQVPAHLAAIYVHPESLQILLEYYGTWALSVMRDTARAIRSSVPTLIPDTCKNIAAFAVSPSNPDIDDDWNKTPLDWAVENVSFEIGRDAGNITNYLSKYLGVGNDWFF